LSGQEEAGVRYDAYKLDYGCYVDLLATKTAPMSTYGVDPAEAVALSDLSSSEIQVPTDDYRAIRRAILKLAKFESRDKGSEFLPLETINPK
jgi:hypothetical protein